MSESTGGLAFITNLRIGNKIAAGFGLILLILTVSSVMAFLSFGRVTAAIGEYSELVGGSAVFRDIDLAVTRLRGRVRAYNFSDEEATADLAIKYAAALRQLIADGLTRVTNPERHALLENIGKQAASYITGFETLHAKNLEQGKLQTGVLDVVGQQMTDGFTAVIAAVVKAGNTDLLPVALDARRLSLMARLDVNKRLGRNDEAAAKSAAQRFADLKATMTQLAAATEVTALLGAEVKADRYVSVGIPACYRPGSRTDDHDERQHAGRPAIAWPQMRSRPRTATLPNRRATEKEAQSITASGSTQVMLFGVAGLVIGIAFAWLIGRGIRARWFACVLAMRALAGGDKAVEIPGVGRKDEIGQMADTVQVFKDNMIETERLRAEQERPRRAPRRSASSQ